MQKRGVNFKKLPIIKEVQNFFDKLGKDIDNLSETNYAKSKGLKAKDAMIKPVVVDPNDGVNVMLRKLSKRDINVCVVVDSKGKFLGEVYEEDLLKLFISKKRVSSDEIVGTLGMEMNKMYNAKKAKDMMREHTFSVVPNTPIDEVIWLLYKENIKYLPVIDKKKIKGVITTSSLLNILE